MANYRKEKQYMSIKRKEKIIAHLHLVRVIINNGGIHMQGKEETRTLPWGCIEYNT